jgi:hypothetical protein
VAWVLEKSMHEAEVAVAAAAAAAATTTPKLRQLQARKKAGSWSNQVVVGLLG